MSQNNKNNSPRQRHLGLNLDNAIRMPGIEDLIDHSSDTDESSTTTSSSNNQLYDRNDPFVLELHELTRDELPDNPLPEVKTRRLLKKKKRPALPANQSGSSLPSSSLSDTSSIAPAPENTKEEFYDARESYHTLSENQQASAVASAGIAQVHSEHGNQPKLTAAPERETTPGQMPETTVTRKPPGFLPFQMPPPE